METTPQTKREVALALCERGHKGRKRKFSEEPYSNHPIRVGKLASEACRNDGRPEDAETCDLAGICHDLLKYSTIGVKTIEHHLGREVANLVVEGTNHYTMELYPTEARASRKSKEFARLSLCSILGQSLKLGEVIDNLREFPEAFKTGAGAAIIYLEEKIELIRALDQALPSLKAEAARAVDAAREIAGRGEHTMKETQIAFTRMDGVALDVLVVIEFTHRERLKTEENQSTEEAVLAAFARGITKWVESKKEGRETWEYSAENLNIGDILGEETNADLAALLAPEGITAWKCIYQLARGEEQSYDRVLAHPKDADEEETE